MDGTPLHLFVHRKGAPAPEYLAIPNRHGIRRSGQPVLVCGTMGMES